jgi:hypothetical protein
MDATSIIVFSIVVFHLLAGFGYVMYKLRPTKKDSAISN